MPIVFNISEVGGVYAATMDSPLQGAKGIPAEISIANDTVRISIPAIGAIYTGVLADGVIRGALEQHGIRLAIDLEPGEYIPPRPQTPQPPYAYLTQDVTFTNPDDGYTLHGTLSLPMFYKPTGKRLYDAVVMVSGSGLQNRDEEIYGHKPFAVLAHHLAINGIASLRYDDRGYGDDSAASADITTATNASDAKAAIRYLRDNVDRLDKVGALGHSEGGTIAFILGADGDADFVVSLAGAAVSGDSILLKQNERILSQQLGDELTHRYITALGMTLEYMEQHPQAKQWPEIDIALSDLELPQQLTDNLKAIIGRRTPWIDHFITYDPSIAIRALSVPVFAANGTLDVQVDSEQNLGALYRLLPPNPASLIKEYPGLNHLMQEARTGMPNEYSEIEQTLSPQLIKDIIDWIQSSVGVRSR